jgi:hypothetical protein
MNNTMEWLKMLPERRASLQEADLNRTVEAQLERAKVPDPRRSDRLHRVVAEREARRRSRTLPNKKTKDGDSPNTQGIAGKKEAPESLDRKTFSGQKHWLSDCTKTSEEDKKKLREEFRAAKGYSS